MHKTLAGLALAAGLAAASAAGAAEITLMRFFGDCQDDQDDPAQASGECGILTALIGRFNATNPDGHVVVARTADWGAYYDLLAASFETASVPDVAVMHASAVPNFTSRGLLMPLGEAFEEAGIDTADLLPAALGTTAPGEEPHALPFDLHTILVHVNAGLMGQAGLLDEDGAVRLPSSPEELVEMGRAFEEATGRTYLALGSQGPGGMMVPLFLSLMWQQGADPISADGATARIDGPEGLEAATFLSRLRDEGLLDPALDRAGAAQAFLDGEAGLLIDGTWAVDGYEDRARSGEVALEDYVVAPLPAIMGDAAAWADSHVWVVPADESRTPEERDAALDLLAFLDDNALHWARTGHLPARRSVLDSAGFRDLPHREGYAAAAGMARTLPPVPNQRGLHEAMASTLAAMWRGELEPKAAVEAMQADLERILRR